MRKRILILVSLVFVICNTALCSETEKFIITYETTNHSLKDDFFRISKGTIIATGKNNNSYKFQTLIICGIWSSTLDYKVLSGNNSWEIKISPNEKLTLKLVCYCLNKGAEPPDSINGVAITKLLIDKNTRIGFCKSQDSTHINYAKYHNNLLNIDTVYTYKGKGVSSDGMCYKLIFGILQNAIKEELGFEKIYNLRINGVLFNEDGSNNPLEEVCRLNKIAIISISTDINVDKEIIFKVISYNILLNDGKIELTCTGSPTDKFLETFNKKRR